MAPASCENRLTYSFLVSLRTDYLHSEGQAMFSVMPEYTWINATAFIGYIDLE